MTALDPNLRDQHSAALDEMDRIVGLVTTGDLERPTPCVDWDVRALLEHHAAQNDALAWALDGGGPDLDRWRSRPLGPAGPDEVTLAAGRLRTALADDGVWERAVWMPEITTQRQLPTPLVVGFHLIDTVVHAWDLGLSIDVSVVLDDDLLRRAAQIASAVPDGPERGQPGAAFGRSVPSDAAAGSFERVLTALGRDPHWRPPAVPAW